MQATSTYEKFRHQLLQKVDTPLFRQIGTTIGNFRSSTLPMMANKITPSVKEYAKRYFIALPVATGALGYISRGSFWFDAAGSSIAVGLEYVGPGTFKDDMAFTVFALHTMQFGYNAWRTIAFHEVSSLIHASIDLVIAAKASTLLSERGKPLQGLTFKKTE